MSFATIGEESPYTEMCGGIMVLCAAVGLGGNLFLSALLYQNFLWTLINRALLTFSLVGMVQSLLCLLPAGIAGVRVNKGGSLPLEGEVCRAYPFIYRYTEMAMLSLMIMLLVYTIISVRQRPTRGQLRTSLWLPPLLCALPFIVFLPPALWFLQKGTVSHVVVDIGSLGECTVDLVRPVKDIDPSLLTSYHIFRGFETVCGFLIPYGVVAGLFVYLLKTVKARKSNRVRGNDQGQHENSSQERSGDQLPVVEGRCQVQVRADPELKYTEGCQAARSDKQTEIVIYLLAVTCILAYAPLVVQLLRELFQLGSTTAPGSNATIRWVSLFMSFLIVLASPTLYSWQYPTIKESLMKLEMLRQKR